MHKEITSNNPGTCPKCGINQNMTQKDFEETVGVLLECTKLKPSCAESFSMLLNRETSFGWEGSLLKIYKVIKIIN